MELNLIAPPRRATIMYGALTLQLQVVFHLVNTAATSTYNGTITMAMPIWLYKEKFAGELKTARLNAYSG